MKFSFDKKILAGFLACTAVLLTVAFLSFRNSEKLVDTNLWVNHTQEVLYEFEQILVSTLDIETGARGFVITGDNSYLNPFNDSKTKLFEHLQKVRELTKDNPDEQRNLDLLDNLCRKSIRHMEQKIDLRKKGFEEAKALVMTGEGKRIVDEIRNVVNHSMTLEQNLLIERKKLSEDDVSSFSMVFISLLVVIAAVLVAVYVIITVNIRALRKAEAETANRNWALAGNSELTKNLQGNKMMRELAQNIINHLALYLDAQSGVFYLKAEDNSGLKMIAGHAYDKEKANQSFVKLGEGVAGQAAAENRNILLQDIDPNYFSVNTSFGNVKPKNVIAVPFAFENSVIGVAELGSIHGFTETQQQYLQFVADNVGITLVAAKSREKMNDLLEETQRQSEELEVQQKELRQTNDNLLKVQMEIKAQNNIINTVAIVSRADIRGDITYVNEEFLKWAKYSKEEVMGRNHRLLKSGHQPDDIFVELWKTISSGKIWRGELKNRAKDGTYYWVDAIIAPVLDHNGKPKEYIAQRFVINEKKKREEDMKALLEETQRQAEELQAQQVELRQTNEELHTKTRLLESSEMELRTQQEELEQTNVELEEKANALEEQKVKLENAKSEIETKAREVEVTSKYKSEFLANMSHELRTPLNSVLILAQLLAENKNNTLGKREIEFAKNIYSSGNDLLTLINEILDLSKIEAGKLQLEIAEVSIQQIAESLTNLFSEMARGKSIDFKIILKETLPPVFNTDKQRVEQILRNLLSNAFKFTEKGGQITLTIDKRVRGSQKNKNVISFAVSDTGIGIPKEKQHVIFEAFQQADGSTKRKYGGTGLGLSISRELVYALGGEIQLQSEEGQGSTFTVILPTQFDPSLIALIDRQVEVKEKEPRKVEVSQQPLKLETTTNIIDDRNIIRENDRVILLIEDDQHFASILLEFIRDRKYKGVIAHQGNTGISYARHYRPDAILLDMKLPVMDGAEVLRRLKNDPELRHIPVQIISAYDYRKESMQLGAFDYLSKPVSKDDLQKTFDHIEEFTNKKVKKLLIVEDDKLQNNIICELIGNGDVKCYSAFRGTDAYQMLEREPFDCIIVDLGLPDMSGFELLEKIKTNSVIKKIPVVVYTGKDLKKEDNARLNKLADAVVLKTVDSKERLLDETVLFLHKIESKLPKEKQKMIRSLHKTDEILKDKKILLVDDDIRNIYSLTNVLEDEGLRCLTAENGKVALQMLQENPDIELVLMDVMMPEMDGYEATTEIRKSSSMNKLPIIALTAKAMKGDKEKCLAVGMSDYISKPVDIGQLLSLMRVWLYR